MTIARPPAVPIGPVPWRRRRWPWTARLRRVQAIASIPRPKRDRRQLAHDTRAAMTAGIARGLGTRR